MPPALEYRYKVTSKHLPASKSFTIEELKCAGEAKANKNAGVCQEFGKTSDFFPQNP
jgi:hypothetical protein